ncbi:unnamed protein product [Pedinophyceae sp. YPF-701]|nr:unnamed protein product [Pedinophyceae sp. YPF-701]
MTPSVAAGRSARELGCEVALLTDRAEDRYFPGEVVAVRIRARNVSSTSAIRITGLRFEARGIERVDTAFVNAKAYAPDVEPVSTAGRKIDRLVLRSHQKLLVKDGILEPGQQTIFAATFRLPAALPPTYRGTAVKYLYFTQVKGDVVEVPPRHTATSDAATGRESGASEEGAPLRGTPSVDSPRSVASSGDAHAPSSSAASDLAPDRALAAAPLAGHGSAPHSPTQATGLATNTKAGSNIYQNHISQQHDGNGSRSTGLFGSILGMLGMAGDGAPPGHPATAVQRTHSFEGPTGSRGIVLVRRALEVLVRDPVAHLRTGLDIGPWGEPHTTHVLLRSREDGTGHPPANATVSALECTAAGMQQAPGEAGSSASVAGAYQALGAVPHVVPHSKTPSEASSFDVSSQATFIEHFRDEHGWGAGDMRGHGALVQQIWDLMELEEDDESLRGGAAAPRPYSHVHELLSGAHPLTAFHRTFNLRHHGLPAVSLSLHPPRGGVLVPGSCFTGVLDLSAGHPGACSALAAPPPPPTPGTPTTASASGRVVRFATPSSAAEARGPSGSVRSTPSRQNSAAVDTWQVPSGAGGGTLQCVRCESVTASIELEEGVNVLYSALVKDPRSHAGGGGSGLGSDSKPGVRIMSTVERGSGAVAQQIAEWRSYTSHMLSESFTLTLPPRAPASFSTPLVSVRWLLRLQLSLRVMREVPAVGEGAATWEAGPLENAEWTLPLIVCAADAV